MNDETERVYRRALRYALISCGKVFRRFVNITYFNLTSYVMIFYAEALVVAAKEIGLEVNADKTKYRVMSGEQTAGLSHTMKVDNSSLKGWKSSNIWERR